MDQFWAAPPITRTLTAVTLIQSALMYGGLVSSYYAGFYPSLTFFSWPPQLYRLVTSFALTGPKLEFVFDVYSIYYYGGALERDMAAGEFLVYLLFVAFNLTITAGWYLGESIYTQAMIMAFIYSWSQRERGNSTKFMYMIDIPCVALPYALLLVTLVSKGWYKTLVESMGILAAHLYNFLTVIYPVYGGGRNYLAVPAFVEKWFTRGDGANRSYGTAFRPSETPRSGETSGWTSGSFWGGSDDNWKGRGTGRRLGS